MTDGDPAGADALALAGVMVRPPARRGATPTGAPLLDVPNLRVAAGERIALLGTNGAGKTTLLHVAALLRPPDAGSVWIGGEAATAANAGRLRATLALLFQDAVLFSGNVLGNAAMALRLRGVPRREAEREAGAWLERFGVIHLAGRSRRALSGGEGQRVVLARAFATRPRLLLLDEPFAALDAPTRAVLLPEVVEHLGAEGAAAVLVTHDLAEAVAFGDRLGVMWRGRLVQIAPPAETMARPGDAGIARLLGSAGVIPGVAARGEDGGWTLGRASGGSIAAASAAPAIRPGDAAVAVVRSGGVRAIRAAEGAPPRWNACAARVARLDPTPGGWRVSLALAGSEDVVLACDGGWDRADLPDRGEAVSAAFPSAAVHLAAPDAG